MIKTNKKQKLKTPDYYCHNILLFQFKLTTVKNINFLFIFAPTYFNLIIN